MNLRIDDNADHYKPELLIGKENKRKLGKSQKKNKK